MAKPLSQPIGEQTFIAELFRGLLLLDKYFAEKPDYFGALAIEAGAVAQALAPLGGLRRSCY